MKSIAKMNQQLLEENKAKLVADQKRIRGVLGREGVRDGDKEFPGEFKPVFDEVGREEGENASEVENYANDLGEMQLLEKHLTKIESALKRIDEGTYGKCSEGDDIEEERLRVLPEAETCMKHSS